MHRNRPQKEESSTPTYEAVSHQPIQMELLASDEPTEFPAVITSLHPGLSYSLMQPAKELGVGFFFARYAFREGHHSTEYQDWLGQSYSGSGLASRAIRPAIEAVGMAGISNIYNSPTLISKSKVRYCAAITALREALNDPVEAASDATLMTVILLGLFEVIKPQYLTHPMMKIISHGGRQSASRPFISTICGLFT